MANKHVQDCQVFRKKVSLHDKRDAFFLFTSKSNCAMAVRKFELLIKKTYNYGKNQRIN